MDNNIFVSTDKTRLDLNIIFNFLSNSYWGKNFTFELVKKCIDNSFCFGAYLDNRQIGFARVITDFTRFAYLADVFILPEYQGKGLGKQMLNSIFSHPDLKDITKWSLNTSDAHGLYKQFGFTSISEPEKYMERKLKK